MRKGAVRSVLDFDISDLLLAAWIVHSTSSADYAWMGMILRSRFDLFDQIKHDFRVKKLIFDFGFSWATILSDKVLYKVHKSHYLDNSFLFCFVQCCRKQRITAIEVFSLLFTVQFFIPEWIYQSVIVCGSFNTLCTQRPSSWNTFFPKCSLLHRTSNVKRCHSLCFNHILTESGTHVVGGYSIGFNRGITKCVTQCALTACMVSQAQMQTLGLLNMQFQCI